MATAKFYGKFFSSLANKTVDLDTDVIKLSLHTDSYVPAQDTHQFRSDLTNEVTGTGYTAGGATVTGISVTYDAGTNVLSFDGADVSWPTSTITARWGVLYDSSPASDATRPLIGYVDFGGNISSTAATFTVVWAATGIGAITVA